MWLMFGLGFALGIIAMWVWELLAVHRRRVTVERWGKPDRGR